MFDLRTGLSLQALHEEDVTQQQNQEHAGLHQRWTGMVKETQQYREMFEESRAALNQPFDQKCIDFDKEKQNFYEKYDVTVMTERKLMLCY